MITSDNDSPQAQLLNWIADVGIDGFGILQSAEQVAEDHRSQTKSVEDAIDSVLRNTGIQIGNKVLKNLISQIPGKVLIEINKKIGFRLITKAGEKGVINLMKLVPIAGGVVGAGFDGWFVNTCGNTAKNIFN